MNFVAGPLAVVASCDGFTLVFKYLNIFSALFLCYMLSFVAFLAAWPAAPRIYKKHEIPLVFVGRKPNVPFSRSARSKQISEGTRSKHRWKTSSNNEPTGPETKQQKTTIFEVKMAPKMDPGDLQKRVRKTVGNSSAQKGLLDASGAAKQSENRILKSSAAIPAFPKGGRVRGE